MACDHLVAQIKATFGIAVTQRDWHHWNGGVFVFDGRSSPFMDSWHLKSTTIFSDPAWQTRDQGTLVATAWQFGLQNLPMLPEEFNFIADPSFRGLMVSRDGTSLTRDAFLTRQRPALVHVLRRVGDPSWDVWRWIARRAEGS